MDAPFQLIAEVFVLECIHQTGKTRPILFISFCLFEPVDVKKGDKYPGLLIFASFMRWMGEIVEFVVGLATQHDDNIDRSCRRSAWYRETVLPMKF